MFPGKLNVVDVDIGCDGHVAVIRPGILKQANILPILLTPLRLVSTLRHISVHSHEVQSYHFYKHRIL
jgi:hypothetical protein